MLTKPYQIIERGIPGYGTVMTCGDVSYFIESIFESFKKRYTLVVGDVMLDRYVCGNADRLSPEAPVLILREALVDECLGGAGNVAANIASLSGLGHAALIAVTGRDAEEISIKKKFGEQVGGMCCLINDSPQRPTTLKTRYVANMHNTHLLRADRESTEPISETTQEILLERVKILLSPPSLSYDAVILSDYRKGLLSNDLCQKIIQEARTRNKIVVIDPKSDDYEKYEGATAITPNIKELKELVSYDFDENDEYDIAQAATNLMLWTECEAVLVTRADKGVLIATQERSKSPGDLPGSSITSFRTTYATIPASARHVVDVSGAGDTAIAAFTLALASGASYHDAAIVAEAAAGCAVACRGTAWVSADSLRVALMGAFTAALERIR